MLWKKKSRFALLEFDSQLPHLLALDKGPGTVREFGVSTSKEK